MQSLQVDIKRVINTGLQRTPMYISMPFIRWLTALMISIYAVTYMLCNTFLLCFIVSAATKDYRMDGDVGWVDTLSFVQLDNNMLETTEQVLRRMRSSSVVTQQSTEHSFPSLEGMQPFRTTNLPPADGFPYVCPKCHKRYCWRDSLRRHQRVECGLEPQHACPTCGRMFKHKHQMVAHERIHHPQFR